uniref:Uncharacterized protein n=1 Tax=Anguilla anguilla TaxID=7936 RepID=A0A0E9UM43_ANGAN
MQCKCYRQKLCKLLWIRASAICL